MRGKSRTLHLAAAGLPLVVAAVVCAGVAMAEPVSRAGTVAGAVIARKAGEEVHFIDVSDWRSVDLKQDLLSGDVLRTNETGQLAIVFSDRTQIRLGRNSTMVVKQVTADTSADTVLQLQSGTIWARAERGGSGVQVQTAAAAAAIRGTDWTMTVTGDKTALNVLEGVVQLTNPQGSVEVRQGEGAAASLGQAPHKVIVVDSDDREQMLFFLPPREAFQRMSPSLFSTTQTRRNADRLSAIPPDRRSTDDWLSLAEAQVATDGRKRAKETMRALDGRPLSADQQARLSLIQAIMAASENRFAEAAKLFDKAQHNLDAKRRAIALYGGYYARSLADPSHVEPLPDRIDGPQTAFLHAYAIGFLQDLKAAIGALKQAERRYPEDAALPGYRAGLALLLNDRQQCKEALDRALALDPNEPIALEVRAQFRAGFQGDNKGALADLEKALTIVPGDSSPWNAVADVHSTRGAVREAEAALKKATEFDPFDPVSHTNLALFYLDMNRVEEAKREIDLAIAADPALDEVRSARGRYYLQVGETDKAIDDILAGTVANPADSQGQVLLSAAYYQKGDRVGAEQAIDNADRLDKNDPVIPALRVIAAVDEYDSHAAVRDAQDYVRRARARGGDYSSLGANQQAGSTLNQAFRFQGLNAWGEYYSDAVFDPFAGTSYIDQSIRGSANLFANSYGYGTDVINNSPNGQLFSATLQGLLLEPTLISSPSRGIDILPRPFVEASLGGGFTSAKGASGSVSEAEVQGYRNLPIPTSYYLDLQWEKTPESRAGEDPADLDVSTDTEIVGANLFLATSPTIYDRVVFYYNDTKTWYDIDAERNAPTGTDRLSTTQDITARSINGGIGWSHTFGYKDTLNAALLYSGLDSHDGNYDEGSAFRSNGSYTQKSYIAAVSHAVGSDDLAWRYGIEGGFLTTRQWQRPDDLAPIDDAAIVSTDDRTSDRTDVGRAYVDLLHQISDNLKAEYAVFGSYLDGDGDHVARVEPRLGVAWSPGEGQWLRAGAMRSSFDLATPTLSPIGIVGLQPNQVSVDTGGYADTYAFRWDAEWTRDLFTAVEYQHQNLHDPQIAAPLISVPFTTAEGHIDRTSVTANLLLEHGFGLSSTLAYLQSKDEGRASSSFGGALPFVPDWAGQVAVTWVNEANIKATLAANYVGRRDSATGAALDDYWTLDAQLTWEPWDKRLEFDLEAYNLLDEDFDVNDKTPGWGRSFKGMLKARF